MLSDSSDDSLRHSGLALEPYTSPFFNPRIRSGNGIPLAAFSAQPNTLGLVAEDDGEPILGVPVFRDDFFRTHNSTKQVCDYEYATGWVTKPSGEIEYVDTGVIEEIVDEDEDDASVLGSDEQARKPLPADIPPPPRPDLRSRTLQLLPDHWSPLPCLEAPSAYSTSTDAEDHISTLSDLGIYAFHNAGPHIPLSPSSSTSPRPSTTGQSPLRRRLPDPTLSPVNHPAASPLLASSTRTSSSLIPEWQILVSQNLELLHCASAEVAAFQQVIEEQGKDFNLLDCVHMCQRVKAAIISTTDSLKGVYSNDPTSDKGLDQLLSLERTVTRLRDLVRYLHPLRLDDKLSISISKLGDHERKLLNLAAKFKCTTKRQRVRHAHGQTAQAHAESHQLRAFGGSGRSTTDNKRIQRRTSVVTRRSSMTGQGL